MGSDAVLCRIEYGVRPFDVCCISGISEIDLTIFPNERESGNVTREWARLMYKYSIKNGLQ